MSNIWHESVIYMAKLNNFRGFARNISEPTHYECLLSWKSSTVKGRFQYFTAQPLKRRLISRLPQLLPFLKLITSLRLYVTKDFFPFCLQKGFVRKKYQTFGSSTFRHVIFASTFLNIICIQKAYCREREIVQFRKFHVLKHRYRIP